MEPEAGPLSRYVPAERTVAARAVLSAGDGYFRVILEKMSLRTLVTQSSRARNDLMSVYDGAGCHRVAARSARALCQSDPDLASMLSIFARLTAAERGAGESLETR
jgi:hypothetical protein